MALSNAMKAQAWHLCRRSPATGQSFGKECEKNAAAGMREHAMRKLLLSILLAGLALPVFAANDAAVAKITVAQLEQTLAAAHGKPDADVARQLSGVELTERLNMVKLAALKAALPGDKAREQLEILANSAAFLDPPAAEILADSTPAPAATRQMLTQVVTYVNTTAHQFPNFMAIRDTIGFENRPQEDVLGPTGIATVSAMPLHSVGKSSVTVTYRDHKETVDEKAAKHGAQMGGLTSWGEFGPILGVAVGDALQGKITWSRWEQGAGEKEAVFHYTVPTEKSHYTVQFCCIADGYSSDGTPNKRVFREIVSYHGEIVFDPSSGAILRITMEADLPATELVTRAGMQVEYSSVEIAGKTYICPVRSVSFLMVHTAQQIGTTSRSSYKGAPKTYMNEVAFSQYRRFGTESRILADDSPAPGASSAPASVDASGSIPARSVVTH
jgi:hypothetical protein